jgi:hypothetical protein
MFRRSSRWTWLVVLAVFNLVFWIGAAIGVGVLVTDTLDLGVESFIRAQHATVVVAWDRMASGRALATAPATRVAVRPTGQAAPLQANVVPTIPAATDTVSTGRPTPIATRPALKSVDPQESTQGAPSDPPVEAAVIPNPTPRPATATPETVAALLTSPLVVSDPGMNGIAGIDAEMARSATGRPVQIRYSEGALNQEVTTALVDYPDLACQDVQLNLEPDRVVVEGNVTIMGLQVDAKVEGTVVARDCMPQAEISSISIAGLLTPGFIRDAIENMVLDSLSWYPPDSPLCMERIVLEKDQVTIYGSRR